MFYVLSYNKTLVGPTGRQAVRRARAGGGVWLKTIRGAPERGYQTRVG